MKNRFNLIITVLISALISVSCQKDEKEEIVESIQSAEDNAMVETEFSAVFESIDDVADVYNSGKGHKDVDDLLYTVLPGGAVVIFTDSLWNDGDGIEFYIDYGELGTDPPQGLLCKDGRYRAGEINASLSKPYYEINSVLTISIPVENGYYVGNGTNMTQVSGTKTVTRTDSTTRNIVVSNAVASNENGTVSWNAERTVSRTLNAGIGLWGDEFTIYGSAYGTNVNGVDFTANVSADDPLVKKLQLGCASTFISGFVTIQNENGGTLELDYDPYNDQACDKVAQVTINDLSRIIFVR